MHDRLFMYNNKNDALFFLSLLHCNNTVKKEHKASVLYVVKLMYLGN